MVDSHEVVAEIEVVAEGEDQQRLTEREEVEIQRQACLIEVQRQFCATLQADLDALRAILQSPVPLPRLQRRTNGKGRDQAYQLLSATASGDRM